MSTLVYSAAGYSGAAIKDGDTVTTANSGATAVNSLGGSTNIWTATTAFGGAYAVTSTNTATNTATVRYPLAASNVTASLAEDFTMPALPTDTNNVTFFTVRHSSGSMVLCQVKQDGSFVVQAGITGNQGALPTPSSQTGGTPTPLVAGNKYRVEVLITGSTSTNTGTVSARIYNYGASATDYIAGSSSAAVVLGASGGTTTNPVTHVDSGIGNYPTSRTIISSNVRLTDGTANWQGPYTATTPPLDLNFTATPQAGNKPLTVNFTVSRVSGTGNGTNLAISLDYGDGSAVGTATVTGTTPANFSHVYNPNTTPVDITATVTATLT